MKVKVENITNTSGNKAPNQFIILMGTTTYFQSYDSIIARRTPKGVTPGQKILGLFSDHRKVS